jgi:hypothetical protein
VQRHPETTLAWIDQIQLLSFGHQGSGKQEAVV